PVMAADAAPERARELAQRCRDRGLEPVMMFSGIYPEAQNHLDVMRSRLRQASAAGIPQLLTFGNINAANSNRPRWIEHFRQPGLGEIDHYRLLLPFAFTGRTMPLCCENISAPLVPRPNQPEGADALARRAREFLELVIRGVQTVRR